MITWAICWLFSQATGTVNEWLVFALLIFAMITDANIFFNLSVWMRTRR